MDVTTYLLLLLPLFIVLYTQDRDAKMHIKQKIASKNSKKEKAEMTELLKKFIGKECIVHTFNSQIVGTVREVEGGAILLDDGKNVEAVNIDFIVRVREYPRRKNGKKKSTVLD